MSDLTSGEDLEAAIQEAMVWIGRATARLLRDAVREHRRDLQKRCQVRPEARLDVLKPLMKGYSEVTGRRQPGTAEEIERELTWIFDTVELIASKVRRRDLALYMLDDGTDDERQACVGLGLVMIRSAPEPVVLDLDAEDADDAAE